MDKKQKEALVLALLEKGKTYREITKEAGVSPNTVKAVMNRAGLDESTSISSRAFEFYSEGKTSVEVAIALNLEAKEAVRYHYEYYMLLGCTEFIKIYLQIKDNPWPYVNLTRLVQNARMGDGEVVDLLKIANGHLPRVRLEYDRVMEEINSSKAELNSWKAEITNAVRTYQDFCDRNLALRKREDELLFSIGELDNKKDELQKTTTELQQHLEIQENNACCDNLNLQIKQEEVIFTYDVFIPPSNMVIDYHPNENETLHYPPQVDSSSRTIIFDTKDLFPTKAQT
jgi:predicted transcriptional regulator